MMVQYGLVSFEIEHIYRWEHRALMSEDGCDYEATHVRLGVQAWCHPLATSAAGLAAAAEASSSDDAGEAWWRQAPGQGGKIGFNRLLSGATSVAWLRQYLLTPRLQLRVVIGGVTVLEAPQPHPDGGNYSLDVRNGPRPLFFNCIGVWGVGKTAAIQWECECWINECTDRSHAPDMLSHRWQMSHDLDELGMTTRTVRGRAVFRRDFMLEHPDRPTPKYPDDFRPRTFHPCPANMKRQNIRSVGSSDGTAVDYSFQDVEQYLNLGRTSKIRRWEGVWKSGYDNASFFTVAKRWVNMVIRVWGGRDCVKQDLINWCAKAVSAFGFTRILDSPRLYYNTELSVDLHRNYAELSTGVLTDGVGRTLKVKIFDDVFNIAQKSLTNFPDELEGLAQRGGKGDDFDFGPELPNGANTRGTYIGRIVAQWLGEQCENPFPPEDEEDEAEQFSESGGEGG